MEEMKHAMDGLRHDIGLSRLYKHCPEEIPYDVEVCLP